MLNPIPLPAIKVNLTVAANFGHTIEYVRINQIPFTLCNLIPNTNYSISLVAKNLAGESGMESHLLARRGMNDCVAMSCITSTSLSLTLSLSSDHESANCSCDVKHSECFHCC